MIRRSAVPAGGSSSGVAARSARPIESSSASGWRVWQRRSRSSANSGSIETSVESIGRWTHGGVEMAGDDPGDERGGVALVDGDAHAGMDALDLGQQLREQPAGGGADRAEAGVAADVVAARTPCRRRCRRARAARGVPVRRPTRPRRSSPPRWRSTSVTPSSFSSRAMCPLTLDCTVYMARAAAENDPWSAIATSVGELSQIHREK